MTQAWAYVIATTLKERDSSEAALGAGLFLAMAAVVSVRADVIAYTDQANQGNGASSPMLDSGGALQFNGASFDGAIFVPSAGFGWEFNCPPAPLAKSRTESLAYPAAGRRSATTVTCISSASRTTCWTSVRPIRNRGMR